MVGWKYAKKILNDWVKGSIDTVEKIQAEDLKFKNRNKHQEETEEEKTARKIKELEESIKNGSG